MRIHRGSFDSISPIAGRHAVSLGTFDGVHRGHQAILRELREVASRSDLAGAIAVTFGFHPRSVISERGAPPSITNLEERIGLLAATGIDDLVVLDFDEALSRVEYDVFIGDLLVSRLGMTHFVLGHDVHFGRERRGNAISIAAFGEAIGFNVSQVASVRDSDLAISSTRIREALAAGDMDDAVRWAGHPIPFAGVVQRGRELGRELGFPTANLPVPPDKIALAQGVYAGWARQGDEWIPTVANLGRAPTFGSGGALRLEAHLLDTQIELYGQRLELALGTRLRPETKFSSREELSEAIAADCRRARVWVTNAPPFAAPDRLTDLTGSDAT
jgi:riboflavin kinase/FMN adenylyltransferase